MFKKLKSTAIKFLRAGLSPVKVSLAIATGICWGIFPIYGPVSMLCLVTIWLARLNAPITLAGLYSMTFIKPLLIIPFLRFGEFVFRADPLGISLTELAREFSKAPLETLQTFGWSFVHATVGWLIAAPLIVSAVYGASMYAIARWQGWREAPVAGVEAAT